MLFSLLLLHTQSLVNGVNFINLRSNSMKKISAPNNSLVLFYNTSLDKIRINNSSSLFKDVLREEFILENRGDENVVISAWIVPVSICSDGVKEIRKGKIEIGQNRSLCLFIGKGDSFIITTPQDQRIDTKLFDQRLNTIESIIDAYMIQLTNRENRKVVCFIEQDKERINVKVGMVIISSVIGIGYILSRCGIKWSGCKNGEEEEENQVATEIVVPIESEII